MLVVRGHLLGALGSFAKRGVASAMGGFNTLHQIRKREGQARRWSKGDSGEAGGAGDGDWGSWVPRCHPAEEQGCKMNLEKYKKFLDGLGTLKGISHPPPCGCAARTGAPAESH